MSNARRRVARSGWQGPNRRTTLMQGEPSCEDLEIKMQSARDSMATSTIHSEILEAPTEEMLPLSALFECAREARDKGFAKGLSVGLIIGGSVTLLTYAIMVLV